MTASTQCPQCETRFKITQAQLEAHHGLVRCGRCQTVFNAVERLQNGSPPAPKETASAPPDDLLLAPLNIADPLSFETTTPAGKTWPWMLGCGLLAIVLLIQALYFYRVELAVSQPALKPALNALCVVLNCTVSLPQQADLMSIESSSLEADPLTPNRIGLEALLRNHADFAQAFPNLELTLTDEQDTLLARRHFSPADYLTPAHSASEGFTQGQEMTLKLTLDIGDVRAAGYRLLLFYP